MQDMYLGSFIIEHIAHNFRSDFPLRVMGSSAIGNGQGIWLGVSSPCM